jgi:hypothetical protein
MLFVTATKVNAGDSRSFHLLEGLLQQHPELKSEFGPERARCEQLVRWLLVGNH